MPGMKRPAALFALIFALSAYAVEDPMRAVAEQYLRTQTRGLPGEVSIQIGHLDPATRMPACSSYEAFTPAGARLWGKTHVGVRCLAPNSWQILLSANISVHANYVVTARALTAGQVLQSADLVTLRGDLASLPAGIVTDAGNATGKSLKNSLAAGQPLRNDQLLAPLAVRQGQPVKLIARGEGFSVSSEGKALNNAAAGQVVQVRVSSGQTISGIVLPDGTVEVQR